MILRTIIIEDEPLGVTNLKMQLQLYCPNVQVVGIGETGSEGIELLNNLSPDLVFLDITLPDMDGFAVLSKFSDPDFKVIFVTGHKDYDHVVRAIDFNTIGYISKPIDSDKLVYAVHEAEKQIKHTQELNLLKSSLLQNLQKSTENNKIAVKVTEDNKNKIVFIDINRIMYLMAKGRYTYIRLSEPSEAVIVNHPLKEFEEKLNPKLFARVHLSYIVHYAYICELKLSEPYQVFVKDEKGKIEIIPISKQEIPNVREWLQLP